MSPVLLKSKSSNRGEVLLSLCYLPSANRLTCTILKAKGLPKKNAMELPDPYMKLFLICNGQQVDMRQTHFKMHTIHPVFNESFIFELPNAIEDLGSVSLELVLLHFDPVTKNEVIGRLEVGPNTLVESARKQWLEIVFGPKRQSAEWHKLTAS